LVNVPKDADPFLGDNMWFDMAVRLTYPDTTVSGLYFYADDSLSPGSDFVLRSDKWKSNDNWVPSLLSAVSMSQTLFLQHDENGCTKLKDTIPNFLRQDTLGHMYDPSAVLETGPPSARALRRYDGIDSILDRRCKQVIQ
jgi:hypothetical protein